MDLFQAFVLAVLQGLTEFLPISSSAHLILPSQLFGWPDQGQAFDVMVHLGTLAAVVIYLARDIRPMVTEGLNQLRRRGGGENSRLGWLVVAATMPSIVCGLFLNDIADTYLRSASIIAFTTIFFGVLLWIADQSAREKHSLLKMSLWAALLIGVAQAVALIPGTSRSGITMTAALLLGFDRTSAARFSFLMSIPVILAAACLKIITLASGEAGGVTDPVVLMLAALVSFASALTCIALFMKFIERTGFMPYVVYRLLLGMLLIGLISTGAV
jgi:undecaprenyl-diphosphatase